MRQLLVYDGDACVGWCQYGTPDDAPNIKNHFHTGPEELYAQHGLARDRKIAKCRWVCGPRSAPAHAQPPVQGLAAFPGQGVAGLAKVGPRHTAARVDHAARTREQRTMNSQHDHPGPADGPARPYDAAPEAPTGQPAQPPHPPQGEPVQPQYQPPEHQPVHEQQPTYGQQPDQQQPPAYGPPGQQQGYQQPPPPDPGPAKGGWRSKLKQAAETAVAQGKQAAAQAKTAAAEQGAKRTAAWAEDPNTLWVGESKDMATSGLGVSKARYRITKDRIQIESGMLGTRSESVPLWSVKDMDVQQAVWQRGKDVGDVLLTLEDPAYSSGQADMFSVSGGSEPGTTSGQVVLDNIEHPHSVVDLLMPLVSEARHKKTVERQSTYMHVNPGMAAMGMGMQQPAAPAAAPAPAGPGLAAQLRELAELRDAGVLTPEEFDAQKTRLLNAQG